MFGYCNQVTSGHKRHNRRVTVDKKSIVRVCIKRADHANEQEEGGKESGQSPSNGQSISFHNRLSRGFEHAVNSRDSPSNVTRL